jgi:hypothetical protein
MAKLNVGKKTISEALETHRSVTKNKAGGQAFKFENVSEYLLGTIGAATFVEPNYYKDAENVEELKNREFNTTGLDEQAIKIINASLEIAQGDNPRDLLSLAHWARTELNMRTTPLILLAIAAKSAKTKQWVRAYVPRIARRADGVKQIVGAYEHLFGWKGFPHCLKKGISDRMSKMSEYEILKYNSDGHPSFKDLLKFCDRRKNYPFSEEVRKYILTGEITNPEAIPMIAARKELTSMTEWNDRVPELAKRAGVTWEVLTSLFGSERHVWETVVNQMGYMAMLRNLGNFLKVDVSMETCKLIARKLASREGVLKSKQLPFRFISAYRTLYPDQSNWMARISGLGINRDRDSWDKQKRQELTQAVEIALDHSVENAITIPGVSFIVADNSGSMSCPISKDSAMTIRDAANVLCSIIHARSEESLIGAFGENVVFPPLTNRNSILTNMQQIATYKDSYRGHSTNAYKTIAHLVDNKVKVDRIVVLSDMQCYGGSVASELTKYRRLINPNVFAHFYDLRGYGSRQTPSGDKLTNVVAGFSEKIFDQILMFEGINSVDGKSVPTLDYIRENY